ncbi:class I glutamine amidotransferase-like protein [Limtongia smithiae]|uniref:class I glutamine amidotransferase-like protein n=1 Tax=Limtongia smithiae TaxID=1125753 RepID=UPI0034CD7729
MASPTNVDIRSTSAYPSPPLSTSADRRNLRVAILETEPYLVTAGGTFAELFERLFTKATEDAEAHAARDVVISNFNVVDGVYPVADEFDGLLITGSLADAYDTDTEWINTLSDYLAEAHATSQAKLVGICFGHQILARALGGEVVQNPKGWELAVTSLPLTPASAATKLFPEVADGALRLQEMHRDHVSRAPVGVEVFASSETSPVQGMYVPDKLLTFQGHPEFDEAIVSTMVAEMRRRGAVNNEDAVDALARAAEANHSDMVGRAVVRFLAGEV